MALPAFIAATTRVRTSNTSGGSGTVAPSGLTSAAEVSWSSRNFASSTTMPVSRGGKTVSLVVGSRSAVGVLAGGHHRGVDQIRFATQGVGTPLQQGRTGLLAGLFDTMGTMGTMVAIGADVVLLATEWAEYCELDPAKLATVARKKRILDGPNVLDPEEWRAVGWTYRALGRR